jgi:apolipoprotein N-acyltransferase
LRLQRVEGSVAALGQIEPLVESLQDGRVDLVVLPEATVALPLDGGPGGPFRKTLMELSRTAGAPLLVGALGTDPGASSRGPSPGEDLPEAPTNSAFLVDPTGVAARYDKVRLVPGMEWGKYVRGEEGEILEADGWRLAPAICYESLFASGVRAQGRKGAKILMNLSSDVWFGEGSGVQGVFLHQHPAHLVMRAVETRMSVARAAYGGVSLLLDPVGRHLVPPLPPGVGMIQARLPVFEGMTFFSMTGDLVGPLSLLILLSLLFFSSTRSRRDVGPSA